LPGPAEGPRLAGARPCGFRQRSHLCYRIDLPNDAETRDLQRKALETLDLLLSDNAVAIDLTTFNAARIWKLYGTQACKGDATEERPQRRSTFLEVPQQLGLVTREQLVQLSRPPEATGIVAKDSGGAFDLEDWISRQGLQVASTGAWRDGKKWLLSPCPWNSAHTNRSAYIVQLASGASPPVATTTPARRSAGRRSGTSRSPAGVAPG